MSAKSTVTTSFFEAVLLALSLVYIFTAPFSKVEESFNIHATYDIVFNLFLNESGNGLEDFDHFDFPGVVPRTFTGSVILSGILYPIIFILNFCSRFGFLSRTAVKLATYMLMRCSLACLTWKALVSIGHTLRDKYDHIVQKWFVVFCFVQFHLLFYSGRLLPNSFALIICSFATNHLIQGNNITCLFLLTFCTIVFRCDVIILVGLILILSLFKRKISFKQVVLYGSICIALSLLPGLFIDTYFWSPPDSLGKTYFDDRIDIKKIDLGLFTIIVPELQVFIFNVLLGQSKNWGVMPFAWFFYSALPKLLLIAYPVSLLSGVNILKRKIELSKMQFSLLGLAYVLIYSFSGHKETRFLYPVLPLFNVSAALGAASIERGYIKTYSLPMLCRLATKIGYYILVVGVSFSFCISMVYLKISSLNYPGGTAIFNLNNFLLYADNEKFEDYSNIKIYIGTYAAMTGATKYFYLDNRDLSNKGFTVSYSKIESEKLLSNICSIEASYNYLLLEKQVYEEMMQVCNENGFTVHHEYHGEPVVNWKNASLSYHNSVLVLTNIG